ncbi:MAG: lipoyl(octanoyl) transferase LipB [Solirubrobacterales bacterium]|nr:lipoyl(octanoyl) transferase LipB [Solirubrobacterales bacterium]
MREIRVVRAGLVGYPEALRAQAAIAAARIAGELPDVLLLLEHPPVYTRGRRSSPSELPMGEDWYRAQGIEVCRTDRGGWATYHGPGQLVGYPIVSLRELGDSGITVGDYVRRMERAMVGSLAEWGVETQVIEGLAGVWTGGEAPVAPGSPGPQRTPVGAGAGEGHARKIGSIGIHVSRGVTTHGLAINVNNDLQPFEWIVPCAIDGVAMTSLCRELGSEQDLEAFAATLVERFGELYGREPVATTVDELVDRAPAAAPLMSAAATSLR